ncbi:MAG TPA: hypothetical protein DHU59_02275 [Clostridiales bacterium]|nr:hypothetical protein [Clostridiales bacterium]
MISKERSIFMGKKQRKISPEAKKAFDIFKMEVANDLGIHNFNNMSRSEYPVYTKPENENNKYYNHDLLY